MAKIEFQLSEEDILRGQQQLYNGYGGDDFRGTSVINPKYAFPGVTLKMSSVGYLSQAPMPLAYMPNSEVIVTSSQRETLPSAPEFQVMGGHRMPSTPDFKDIRGPQMQSTSDFEVIRGHPMPSTSEFEVIRGHPMASAFMKSPLTTGEKNAEVSRMSLMAPPMPPLILSPLQMAVQGVLIFPGMSTLRSKRSFPVTLVGEAGDVEDATRSHEGITGGKEARRGEYPWIALLGKKLSNGM